jgi:dTDP-4-dehydrorhamnose reductase
MKNLKVLMFGPGWLALKVQMFLESLGATVDLPDKVSGDIADPVKVAKCIDLCKPDIILNPAGKTHVAPGTNIDSCEATPEAREATHRSNVIGPMVLGAACMKRGIYLVHFSSGCIFDGPSPGPGGWTENDTPTPVSYYAQTKVEGEMALSDADALILRLRMPIDGDRHPRNLITKLAGYREVIDVNNSVTVIPDFLLAMRALIERRRTGVYHVTNPVPVRHANILAWYREIVDRSHDYALVPADQMSRLATAGRSNCILDTSKMEFLEDVFLRPAHVAIRQCLREYARRVA